MSCRKLRPCFSHIDRQATANQNPRDGFIVAAPCACKEPEAYAHYVLIRRDLPLGFAAAQIVHAAGESSPGLLPEGTNAIVLTVSDETELLAYAKKLRDFQISHKLIQEDDAPYCGQATAIGVVPKPRAELRSFFSSLPLYGKEDRKTG